MEQWSDGVYLLGTYGDLKTGCWMLISGNSGAILEIPPYSPGQFSPTIAAQIACEQRNIGVDLVLCSHCHGDHIAELTLKEFYKAFPVAQIHLHQGFKPAVPNGIPVHYFDDEIMLELGGEPLYLIHAPKHSATDTMVVFKGVMFTGDWELNTIRSVHDGKGAGSVPLKTKLKSIELLKRFPAKQGYLIHKVFSVHANDRRDDVDFVALMEDTKVDRQFW